MCFSGAVESSISAPMCNTTCPLKGNSLYPWRTVAPCSAHHHAVASSLSPHGSQNASTSSWSQGLLNVHVWDLLVLPRAGLSLQSTISAFMQNSWSTPSRRTSCSRRRRTDLHVGLGIMPPTLRSSPVSSMPRIFSTLLCSPRWSSRAAAAPQANRRVLLNVHNHVLGDLVGPALAACSETHVSAGTLG